MTILESFTYVKRGVRQGCILSPDLFNLYGENIMRHLDGIGNLVVGGYSLTNLKNGDDIIVIAQSKKDYKKY